MNKLNKVLSTVLVLGSIGVAALVGAAVRPVVPTQTIDQIRPLAPVAKAAPTTITLPEVLVVGTTPRKTARPAARTASLSTSDTSCNFDWTRMEQGPAARQVRGFCSN